MYYPSKSNGYRGLGDYLTQMKNNCSKEDFDRTCRSRIFNITNFADLLYNSICNNDFTCSNSIQCQSALSIRDENSSYLEAIVEVVPLCEYGTMGTSLNHYKSVYYKISSWDLLPVKCQQIYLSIFIFYIILSFIITLMNIFICIIYSSKKESNSRIYKISLACADLLVGLFVLPVVLITSYQKAHSTPLRAKEGLNSLSFYNLEREKVKRSFISITYR